jgi:hypothetical protein
MESLAGSGYRAVTETVVTVVAWPPLATLSHTGQTNAGSKHCTRDIGGSKGLRPTGVMAMSIRRSRRSRIDATAMDLRQVRVSSHVVAPVYEGNCRTEEEGGTRQAKLMRCSNSVLLLQLCVRLIVVSCLQQLQ